MARRISSATGAPVLADSAFKGSSCSGFKYMRVACIGHILPYVPRHCQENSAPRAIKRGGMILPRQNGTKTHGSIDRRGHSFFFEKEWPTVRPHRAPRERCSASSHFHDMADV